MIAAAWAQAGPGGAPPALVSFAPLILVFVVFYFLLIRPQQQKARQHRTMLENLKKNDEVITSGGLYGKVVGLDPRVVTLEIADNVRVRVDRPQIASLARGGKEDTRVKNEAAKPKEGEKSTVEKSTLYDWARRFIPAKDDPSKSKEKEKGK